MDRTPVTWDALNEAAAYHDPEQFGGFATLVKPPQGRAEHRNWPEWTFVPVVTLLSADRSAQDAYISQAVFRGRDRAAVNVWSVQVVWVDLDTYNVPELAWLAPQQRAARVLRFCQAEGIPAPSRIIDTGRGLALKWVLTKPLPLPALVRWKRVQNQLCSLFSRMGGDAKAKDIGRVLRLVGTTNTKVDRIVSILHDDPEARYRFDDLAEQVLPVARDIIRAHRRRHRQPTLFGPETGRRDSETGRRPVRGFSDRELAWHRLEDLRALTRLRGEQLAGYQMHMIFWQINFLALSGATSQGRLWNEAQSLAAQFAPGCRLRQSDIGTVLRKAKAHEQGERVEYAGKTYPTLYTPTNQTLIDQFRISEHEQAQLRTIISPELALERRRTRDINRRREERGSTDRATYLESSRNEELRARVKQLRSQGLSLRKIGKEVGISHVRVSKLLKQGC